MLLRAESATYRTELYPPYHAAPPAMPDDLAHQWENAPALYEALGWTVADDDALEADDLMGSLASVEAAAGGARRSSPATATCSSAPATGSRSCCSAPAKRGPTSWARPRSSTRYGIPPAIVPDFIALRGDPSDGLPGAKGIGEKTAADLLRRHGSLEAAIAGAIREKPSVRRALLEQADELRAFKDIATLRDADVERPPDRPTDRAGGAAAARELGMDASRSAWSWPASSWLYGVNLTVMHVAVGHHVIAALEPQHAALARRRRSRPRRRARPSRSPRRARSRAGCRSGSRPPRARRSARGAGASTAPACPRRR